MLFKVMTSSSFFTCAHKDFLIGYITFSPNYTSKHKPYIGGKCYFPTEYACI